MKHGDRVDMADQNGKGDSAVAGGVNYYCLIWQEFWWPKSLPQYVPSLLYECFLKHAPFVFVKSEELSKNHWDTWVALPQTPTLQA